LGVQPLPFLIFSVCTPCTGGGSLAHWLTVQQSWQFRFQPADMAVTGTQLGGPTARFLGPPPSSTILHHPPPPLVARAPMALLWFLWIRDHAFGLCLTILLPHCVACRFDRVARPQRHTGNSIVPIDPLSSSFYPHDTVFCTVTPPFHILISSFTCHRILVPSCRLSHPQQPTPPFPASALASFSFSLLYYASADKNTMPSWLCKKTSRRPYLRLWRGKKQETKTG